MSGHRPRTYSPSRHYNDPPRNSPGAVYVTSFDTSTRGGSPSQPRASVGSASSSRPNVTYEAQPMRKSTMTDGKTKTEYAIRPRNDSYAPTESKKPLSVSTRNLSPTRRGPLLVASPRDMTPTVIRDDSSRLLQPNLPHKYNANQHQRHNSTSHADLDSRGTARERRERTYHSRGPYVQKSYHDSRPSLRNADDEGWSYTGPREQFHRDYPQNTAERREPLPRKDRPVSHYESERPAGKRDQDAPIHTARQSGRVDRADPDRFGSRSGFDSDPDRALEAPRRRNSTRQPVVHQQQYRDDGYSSARDDYESQAPYKYKPGRYDDDVRPKERHRDSGREPERERDYERKYHRDNDRDRDRERDRERERERDRDRDRLRDYERDDRTQDSRRKQRSRENSPERSSSGLKSLATGALSSLAAAGVLKGATNRDNKDRVDDSDDDNRRERRPKKHRHRSRRDGDYDDAAVEDDRRRDERRRSRNQDVSTSDSSEDHASRRQNSHRRHRDDDEPEEKSVSGDNRPERASSRVRTRDRDEADTDTDRPSRDTVPSNNQDGEVKGLETRTLSPGENGDDRPRRVQLVEPVKEKEEFKPKGILKPARQVPFPEDPNPVREGVAPLKDATKDGIPPNARWTKINRLLVNPEALEKAHERFEEREDYVIVLRVISREEIQKLAEKTKEIREARELEWQRKLEDRRRRKNDRSSDTTVSEHGEYYSYDSDAEQKPQLAIEAPPAPAADLYGLQSQQNSHVPVRNLVGGAPVPDINVQSNYSQNV